MKMFSLLLAVVMPVASMAGEGVVKDRKGHEWKLRTDATPRAGSAINIGTATGQFLMTVRDQDRQTKINDLAKMIDEARRANPPGSVKVGSGTLTIDEAEGLKELLGRIQDVARTLPK